MQMLWCTVGLAGKTSSSVLRGLVGGDGLSSISICQRDSLILVLRLCGCQVGMTDGAGYHQHNIGLRSNVMG